MFTSDNNRKYPVEHEPTKGKKNNSNVANDIQYPIYINCKPPQRNNTVPKITKEFPLTSITTIGLKGKKAFCIHVRDDHVYYYYTLKAIEIAFKIQGYVAAANAVDILINSGDGDNDDIDGGKKLFLWNS
ncbi:hypothetical protein LSM04_006801 [Trypanosoma melophagium]|uniref:uncharacterized protein n=1 Tax=Trypanosoma melophagium TaxID=715481 RepID=UPI003519F24C|nr:hypothetical protein LSM04_006801 [Trypanosoma melophagium]